MVSIAGSFVYLMFYTFAFTLVIRSVLPAEIVFNAGPIISYSMFAYNVFIVAFYGNALKQQVTWRKSRFNQINMAKTNTLSFYILLFRVKLPGS